MAKSHKNTININGKVYDARTARLLDSSHASKTRGTSIDGVMPRPSEIITPVQNSLSPKTHKQREVAASKKRSLQHSKTLMHRVSRKPVKAHENSEITSHSRAASDLKARRAHSIARSSFIDKFDPPGMRVERKTADLSVKQHPEEHVTPQHHTKPKTAVHRHNHNQVHSQTESERLFNQALEKSAPHLTKKKRSKRGSKVAKWGAVAVSATLLAALVVYLNIPNINLKLASNKAGFSAVMPGYHPSGFKQSGVISAENGQVTISFVSNTDNRSYDVKQEVSSWNSQTMQDSFLAANSKSYTTSQEGGRTIYFYDQGSATWVNGGVWYQVESDNLSSDQLVKIAASL